jgi:hypothetical protein
MAPKQEIARKQSLAKATGGALLKEPTQRRSSTTKPHLTKTNQRVSLQSQSIHELPKEDTGTLVPPKYPVPP